MAGKREFVQLRDEWYEKLRESGFDDIEYSSGAIRTDTKLIERMSRGDGNAEFYRRVSCFLHEFKWASETEEHIWELYSEGVPYRDIAERLGVHYVAIFRFIKRVLDGPFRDYDPDRENECKPSDRGQSRHSKLDQYPVKTFHTFSQPGSKVSEGSEIAPISRTPSTTIKKNPESQESSQNQTSGSSATPMIQLTFWDFSSGTF